MKSILLAAAVLLAGMSGAYAGNCELRVGRDTCEEVRVNSGARDWFERHPSPKLTAEDMAEARARAERVRKWEAICQPRIVTSADGIGRYVYVADSCQNGRAD
jgi:hypothetical protein